MPPTRLAPPRIATARTFNSCPAIAVGTAWCTRWAWTNPATAARKPRYLGFLAAVAGFVQAHRVHQAVPTAMAGQELNVLAVAILGGASLVGGIGSTAGVVLGVLFLAILQNGLNLVGVSSYFFGVVIGLAILLSTGMTGYAERLARRRRVTSAG